MTPADYQDLGVARGGRRAGPPSGASPPPNALAPTVLARNALASDPRLDERLCVDRRWAGIDLELVSTSWRREQHPERSDGSTDYAAIEILRAGAFEKRQGRRCVLADVGTLVFFNAGERFGIRHPFGRANAGVTIRIGPAAWEAVSRSRPAARRADEAFRHGSAPCPAALLLAVHQLLAGTATLDALACEERLLRLVDEAVALDAHDGDPLPAPAAAHERARVVRAFLNESFAQPIRLSHVAAAAECSVWHVAKQFRQATGTTIHACLQRLRLRHALQAIAQGGSDLTRVALDVGYSSHSHFTAAFKAEFGLAPRHARRSVRPAG